jgi:hypothetical protein
MSHLRALTAVFTLLALAGCPSNVTDDDDDDDDVVPDCIPSQASFDTNVLPIIDQYCSRCHGAEPDYGAPMSLLEYEPLVEGSDGLRTVDKMIDRLSVAEMPPSGNPMPSHGEYETLLAWASCGAEHFDYDNGLDASQPIWEAPNEAPLGTTSIDLTAEGHRVGINALDDYQFFTFSNLVAEDRFIRRIEPVIDETRVVHHITLQRMNGNTDYLYTWAPGTGAIEFPDGGLRLTPGDGFFMNIHYNNGAGIEDVADWSGVRMWVGPTEGTEWVMLAPSTWDIRVPARGTADAVADCNVTEEFQILAGMPHMHEIGSAFEHVIQRGDGTEETLIALTGWSFELQFFYEMSATVRPGDRMRLTCSYDNDKDRPVTAGQGTTDEMCFNFMYVTPPSAAGQCD